MFGAEFVMGLQQGKNEAQDEIEELKDERDKLQLGNLNLLDNNKKLRDRVSELEKCPEICHGCSTRVKDLETRIAELEGTCMAYWVSRELDEERIKKLEKTLTKVAEALSEAEADCVGGGEYYSMKWFYKAVDVLKEAGFELKSTE